MWQIQWRKGQSGHAWLSAEQACRYLLAYLDITVPPRSHLALWSSSPGGVCTNTMLSSLGFRNHYCMAIFRADTKKAKDEDPHLPYFGVKLHGHSEYLIASHEGECRFTVWLWPPPVPASRCIQLRLRIESGLSWRRPYQITLQTNLPPLLLWATVSGTSGSIYLGCPGVFLITVSLSLFNFFNAKFL